MIVNTDITELGETPRYNIRAEIIQKISTEDERVQLNKMMEDQIKMLFLKDLDQ